MVGVTIQSMLVLAFLLNTGKADAQGKAGTDSDCQINIPAKRLVYDRSVVIGCLELASSKPAATLIVRLDSQFFDGLERIRTSHGSVFRKAGHPVSKYPEEFTVVIHLVVANNSLQKSSPDPMSSTPVRLPDEMRPQHVIVRWLDSSERVLTEKSGDLQEKEEAWPELRPPAVWYQATVKGVNENLASSVEVVMIGAGGVLLGTTRGKL